MAQPQNVYDHSKRDWLKQVARGGDYPRHKFYYNVDGNPTYVCYHRNIDAAETDTDWIVYKHVWSGDNMTDREGPRLGAVDSEPSGLNWNI